MAVTTTARLGLTRWSAGTDAFTRAQMDASMAALEANAAMYSSGTLAARPAASKAGRFYQVTDAAAEAPTLFYDTGSAWVEIRPSLSAYATDTDLTNGLAGKANSTHTHAAADVTSGTFAVARLGTGTASASTYLRGDGAWTTFPTQTLAALTDTTITSPAAGHFLQYDTGTSKWVNSTITTSEVVNLDTALAGKAASSHSHAIGDLPVAASGTSSTTQLVRADDSRLSDARTPVAHVHAAADVSSGTLDIARLPVASSGTSNTTQVVRADDARLSNARTPVAHTHSGADINTGTVAITYLPVAASGTSSTTLLVRADDSRLSDARTPVAHTHAIGDLPVAASGTSSTTQLVRADDSRLSNARTPTAHTHAIGDLPVAASGTSSTTQVVRADDSRLSNARTPTAHTHTLEDLPEAWLKRAVRVASTANVAIPPGGTALTIDGVALANNDRVLLKDQTTTSQNGIYVVGGIGSSVTLTRANGANTATEIAGGTVSIDQGTAHGGQIWTTTFKTTDALGTTAMLWYKVTDSSQMAANGGTTAGTWVQANDTRLSNARTPTAHTHAAADVNSGTLDIARLPVATSGTSNTTQVVRADDARLSNARTPTAHAHSGADITSGTVAITYLPVATSGTSNTTQVVRADDARLSNARTPTAHTHAQSDVTNLTTDLAAKAPLASPSFTGTATTQNATIGTADAHVLRERALVVESHARNFVYTHTDGILTKLEERDGTTVLRTVTYNYSGGELTSTTETANGLTITTTYNQTNGLPSTTTRSVA